MEWFDDVDNWNEWTGPNISASRKRVLTTLWFGEAYERACLGYNFEGTFDRTGSNLTADGSHDDRIKLQGLENFTFTLEDARRNPLTGEFEEGEDIGEEDPAEVAHLAAGDSDNSEVEEFSENDGSDSDEGGCTTDGEDGPDYECHDGMEVMEQCPEKLEGLHIAHRFDSGWSGVLGKVLRKVTLSIEAPEDNGRYATKYPDSRKEYFHDLFAEDYGINKMWVVVRPCAS